MTNERLPLDGRPRCECAVGRRPERPRERPRRAKETPMPTVVKNAFRPGTAANGVVGVIALLSFIWGALFLTVPYKAALVVTDWDVAAALARVGLDPEPLAAAGVSGQQVQGVVSAARAHLAESLGELKEADADLGTAVA